MRVFVTGGTGAIGRPAIRALVTAGHDVKALVRSPAKAEQVRRQGAYPVEVSLFDRAELSAAFRGLDAIINLATALPRAGEFHKRSAWAQNDRIRTDGSAAVVDAALHAEVPKLIQESVVMIYRDGGSDWIDEDWPVDDFPAARSNIAAEASARRFSAAGGDGVVLRFGWFYGPGAAHSESFLALARRWRIAAMLGAPNGYVSSIHVDDGGRAVAAALAAPPGTYNVVDDEPVTKSGYADALAGAAARRLYLRFPGRLAGLFGTGLTSLTRSLRVSNSRFKRSVSWAPDYPSVREGFVDLAARRHAAG